MNMVQIVLSKRKAKDLVTVLDSMRNGDPICITGYDHAINVDDLRDQVKKQVLEQI